MTPLEDLATEVKSRLEAFRDRTPMWGGNEAVEMQAITLIEIEAFLRDKSTHRQVLDAYIEELHKVCPKVGNRVLSAVVEDPKQFGQLLFEVCTNLRKRLNLE